METEPPCSLGHAVPDRIQQVFLNLTLNAVDAMPNGGKLTIHLLPDSHPRGVQITFTDTGTGIPDHVRDSIFDPFFTSKDVGQGTGLGLAPAGAPPSARERLPASRRSPAGTAGAETSPGRPSAPTYLRSKMLST